MILKLARIGNSRGVRLPKAVIEQAGLGDEVEVTVRGDKIVLRSARNARAGWDDAFRRAITKHGKDRIDAALDRVSNRFDDEEWTW